MAATGRGLDSERQLFDARRRTLTEQLAAMESQARDAKARAEGADSRVGGV